MLNQIIHLWINFFDITVAASQFFKFLQTEIKAHQFKHTHIHFLNTTNTATCIKLSSIDFNRKVQWKNYSLYQNIFEHIGG